ncbi:DUF309 domain-containing protein [Mesorhizobium huakuii]|uniref:DUF309 domain-containing protein n=1 Tax=Mesorhizobium huakuii TaxID=28104 RepID=UPI003D7A4400
MTVAVDEALSSNEFRWGIDLFNDGITGKLTRLGSPFGTLRKKRSASPALQGIDSVSAAGVKIREAKRVAAARHAARAAALFRQVIDLPNRDFEAALRMKPAALAVYAEAAITSPAVLRESMPWPA